MDAMQLADDLDAAGKALRGETSGNAQFDACAGRHDAIISTLLASIASFVSAPTGINDRSVAGDLVTASNELLQLIPAKIADPTTPPPGV